MDITDYTIWKTIKPILELRIKNGVFFLIIVGILFPVTWTFVEMNDFWNILNYAFIIPFTITTGRRLILELNNSFIISLENINSTVLEEIDVQKIKLVTFFNSKLIIYFLILVTLISQLNYIVSDLGILTQSSNFYKWNLIYDNNFSPSLFSKNLFFIYYISVQSILLIFSLICIAGLVQYTAIFYDTFHNNKLQLTNNLPNPPYLGLDNYHVIISSFLMLILIILANSFTYLINMRAIMPLNLIAFWFLILIVFIILFIIKNTLNNYLKFEKENLTKQLASLKKDELKYMQFSESLMNVKTQIFSMKALITTFIGIFLSLLSIVIAFVKPDWINTIRQFVEIEIIPWF